MKIRNGFVSNSSSSSFVVLKDALSNIQIDQILNIEYYVEKFISEDENLADEFSYYNTDAWNIKEYDDFIFGETSMDNFSMSSFFNHINVDRRFVSWDDGYIDEPRTSQLNDLKNMRKRLRKNKIDNINNNYDEM